MSPEQPSPSQLVVDSLDRPDVQTAGVPHDALGDPPHLDQPLGMDAFENRWLAQALRWHTNDAFYSAASLIGGLLLMEVFARIVELSYFPPVSHVLGRLWRLTADGEILGDLGRSVLNLLVGFVISALAGVAVGIAMGRYKIVEKMLDPYVTALMTAPTVVFAPIYFSVFGLARWSIIALIVQYSVFIIIVNTVTAVQSVDRELIEMASVFGAGERQRLRLIVFPASLPLIMAGLRLGMGRAVKGMINGELLIAVVGLGATSQEFARSRDAEGVFAVLIVVIVVALLATKLVELVDRHVSSWLPNSQR
jgi:NitT/TauT family transport system permease protein